VYSPGDDLEVLLWAVCANAATLKKQSAKVRRIGVVITDKNFI